MKAIITKTVSKKKIGTQSNEVIELKIVLRLFGIPLYKSISTINFC